MKKQHSTDALPSIQPLNILKSHLTSWSKKRRRTGNPINLNQQIGSHLSRIQTIRNFPSTSINNTSTSTSTSSTSHKRQKTTPTTNHTPPIQPLYTNATRGYGIYATQPIAAGDILISEEPLITLQTPLNSQCNNICTKCHVPLGSLVNQLQHAATSVVKLPTELPLISSNPVLFSDIQTKKECPNKKSGCNKSWCSSKCYDHDIPIHAMLCCANAACKKFHDHAADTDHLFLLVAKVIAVTMHALKTDSQGVDAALLSKTTTYPKWWQEYVHPLWWDIVPMRATEEEDDDDEEEEEEEEGEDGKQIQKRRCSAKCSL